MEFLSQIVVSTTIAATIAFGGFQISAEGQTFWTIPQSDAIGYTWSTWSTQLAKYRSGKIPVIFTNPDLAVGLLTLGIIGVRLTLKRK